MLLPGPEAQQLATYTGWLMHGIRGGFVAGLLFVLPGALAIMALSVVYALYGNVGAVAALFFGLKAAVLAIVVQAVVRIGSRALRNRAMQAIAAISFIAIFFFAAPFPLIVLAAAVLGFIGAQSGSEMFAGGRHGDAAEAEADSATILGDAPPAGGRPNRRRLFLTAALLLVLWLGPVAVLWAALGTGHVFAEIAVFFSKMAVVTFGGAYAVLAWVAQAGVETYGWLQPGEMLDGLGMAETTPGPLIMVTQFVGFMAAFREPGLLAALPAGVLGGALTTWVTFAPCFLWIFLGAPFVERLRENRALAAALAAITAAVVGVILNLALWFALHTIFGTVGRFEGVGPVGRRAAAGIAEPLGACPFGRGADRRLRLPHRRRTAADGCGGGRVGAGGCGGGVDRGGCQLFLHPRCHSDRSPGFNPGRSGGISSPDSGPCG